jgi:hypothetical protein
MKITVKAFGSLVKETENIEEVKRLFSKNMYICPLVSFKNGDIEILWERQGNKVFLISIKICGSVVWFNRPVDKDPVDMSLNLFESLHWVPVYYKLMKLTPVNEIVRVVNKIERRSYATTI